MNALDVSRWQFGITTVYHFVLVPLTIGLAPLLAIMQTAWVVTGNNSWYRLTRFFGKLFLINFALGVATGIVQEFQFGMNWSEYSRFVGDVFGAPLALEGLVAFFLESTFLGLWIFGWTRLPKLVHLACIWMVAIGVNASAFFIIAANSFMQHPVGAVYNPETGRAELISITELLTNNTALAAFPHTVAGSLLTASTFVAGICGWWMVRSHKVGTLDDARTMYRPAAIGACAVMILSGGALAATGDVQGKLMFQQQPMKMASAESLCYTEKDPKFSVLTVGTHNNCASVAHAISVPYVLPFLAEGKFTDVTLKGVEDLQKEYEQKFGPRNYRPNLFVTYWSFRAMIGLAAGSALLALAGLWVTRGGRIPSQRWFAWLSILAIPTPFLANSAGWVFTEMGRQPWVVAPNPTGVEQIRLTVDLAVSHHSAATVWLSLITFTLLYGALGVVWFWLIRRYTIEGPLEHDTEPASPVTDDDSVKPLSFAY
ncbi:cytochrome ubiquinol oxidase subunit I [Mycobacteroides chelonae]|jgi:cytochrome d ubiquinol oxidase subunit I|uniref:Cytochrome ubiquinol oxidase subunit I n=1 Tax=Mycobacteroides chelonae TaxID=1774 RepID=A0A1S1LW21_MYCCH|nr:MULTISPECIES: cytochrome ubiquinol oxidase subunit I [Mycobacteroides]AMW20137.1 cytochrome bd-type menaquinol oxidase subunit I [Mycobacterium sp. QIA-37]PKQ57467.1 cytochrome ubiquinol oxidase subunit I [Mycobacterium sp. MHSD3]SKL76612.1 Probable integral membrane cytochrome D ubiquinol oxidase (Subunit I) CydA [Mycobacteroides abscessus subsp. bolletii]AYM42361.1 cytochrome ubiquinol oxidase subunit I [[Mycobacterium] chelonae subsp. gwanakae]KRQ26229.1 cytochrome BD ubiquinol oxidase s